MPPNNNNKPDPIVTTPDSAALIAALRLDVEDLKRRQINFNTDILGLFETVSTVPTGIPKNTYDQVKIYVNKIGRAHV